MLPTALWAWGAGGPNLSSTDETLQKQEAGASNPLRRTKQPRPQPVVDNRTTYHFPPVKEEPVVGLATPRYAWGGWDLGDPEPSKPSALPRTLLSYLSRALKMTVPTVIAGQVKSIRTIVEQSAPPLSLGTCGSPLESFSYAVLTQRRQV